MIARWGRNGRREGGRGGAKKNRRSSRAAQRQRPKLKVRRQSVGQLTQQTHGTRRSPARSEPPRSIDATPPLKYSLLSLIWSLSSFQSSTVFLSMSIVELRVELPVYSRSFHVHVSSSCTVLDVKHAIFSTCAGAPRVDGQRLFWRGRVLDDHERVEDIWKVLPLSLIFPKSSLIHIHKQSPNDFPVIHLAVHPTAWTTTPIEPSSSTPQYLSTPSTGSTMPTPSPPQFTRRAQSTPASRPSWATAHHNSSPYFGQPPMMSTPTPLPYISMKHENALSALTTGRISQSMAASDLELLKLQTKAVLAQHGYSWPAIFDELWPPVPRER